MEERDLDWIDVTHLPFPVLPSPTLETVGQGFLVLAPSVLRHFFPEIEPPVWGTIQQRGLLTPEVAIQFAELRLHLLLPEHYEIRGLYWNAMRACWYVLLASPHIPRTIEGAPLPLVCPWYVRTADGQAHLERIDFEAGEHYGSYY